MKHEVWFWSKNDADCGWEWAPKERKHLHPNYMPVFRYARDVIGTLNNLVDGWIDWNMMLDRKGGPNWAKNWCVAPVIVDSDLDEVFFAPLYYTMAHFSRYIRPGSIRIGFELSNEELMVTAVENREGSIAVLILNEYEEAKEFSIQLKNKSEQFGISGKAIQTVCIPTYE